MISIWGDEEATKILRGGSVLHKALKTYRSDPRARALFTVNAKNIDQISAVTQIVADYGIALSYNYFSPTDQYLRKLAEHAPNDDEFFRLSSSDDNLILTPNSLERIRDRIDDMIELYPDIQVFGLLRLRVVENHGRFAFLIVRPFAVDGPATTASADFSRRRGGLQSDVALSGTGEISPGKNIDLPRTTAGYTPPSFGHESFAVSSPLALLSHASNPVSVRRPAGSLPASSRRFLTVPPLRFASVTVTNFRKDFHLLIDAHAGRTGRRPLRGSLASRERQALRRASLHVATG